MWPNQIQLASGVQGGALATKACCNNLAYGLSETMVFVFLRVDHNAHLKQNTEFVLLPRPTFALLIKILPP